MKINKKGLDFIKSFEGFRSKPYLCSAGVPTIGWGSTRYADGRKVSMGDKSITKSEGDELFLNTITKYEDIVNSKINVELTDNQFSALVSHTYNTGGSSTLFSLVNKKASDEEIYNWFTTKYITAKGVKLNGLVRRRKAEADLFFTK